MRVSWDEPVFQDNSGEDPSVIPSSSNGGNFKEGQHLVLFGYMALVLSYYNQLFLIYLK